MKKSTFSCERCGYSIKILSSGSITPIKFRCIRCAKKTNFIPQKEKKIEERPQQGYVLAADLNINNDHVHINGISVQGNVSANRTTGVKLQNMSITKNKEEKMGGKLTITNSEQFSVKNNLIFDASIDSSKLFQIDGNLIGYEFEDRDLLIDSINALIAGGKNQEQVIKELKNIEKVVGNNEERAVIISEKIASANKGNFKIITGKILSTLKSVGLDTVENVKNRGIDGAVQWLINLIAMADKLT